MTPEKKRYEEHLINIAQIYVVHFIFLNTSSCMQCTQFQRIFCLKQYIIFDPIKIATNRTKEKFMTMIVMIVTFYTLFLGGLNLED